MWPGQEAKFLSHKIITMNNPSNFTTSDLALSTALVCFRHPLIGVSKEGARWTFEFQNTFELQNDVKKFFDYELLIEPIDYFNTLKTLKTRLYNHSDIW